MSVSPRVKYVAGAGVVIVSLAAVILGLTLGLQTPALEDGGSPPGPVPPQPPPDGSSGWDSAAGQYRYAAVSSDATLCSKIGVDILARYDGSAVDAAIATMLCVGVVNCHSTGIGGGHFMTIYERPNNCSTCPKEATTIIAREMAPDAAYRDMFVNQTDKATNGGLAIGVPGEIRGFYEAWKRYGRVAWEHLFTATIALMEDGFEVPPSLPSAIQSYADIIRNDPNLAELFMRDGEFLKEGDIMYNPKLARTFRNISLAPEAFYDRNSQLAKDIVADIAEYDGVITLDDLEKYVASFKDPLKVHLENGNFDLYAPRPPSSGAVIEYIMNTLDGYHFSERDLETLDDRVLSYHRIAEAFKFAYARRSGLGDEDFWDVTELLRNLTSDDYADYTRSRITDDQTQNTSYYEPDFADFEDAGTAHASIFAADGAAVSITSTINLFFGSNVRGSRTGIIFNNEMDDFSTPGLDNSFGVPPSPSNFIVPGKRPMSSMCPMLAVDADGNVRFISGAAGGTRITTATAFVTMHSLWFNYTVKEATDMGRLHHQLVPTYLQYGREFDEEVIELLAEQKGHELNRVSSNGVVISIHNTCTDADFADHTGCVHAVSDARKGGEPDGY